MSNNLAILNMNENGSNLEADTLKYLLAARDKRIISLEIELVSLKNTMADLRQQLQNRSEQNGSEDRHGNRGHSCSEESKIHSMQLEIEALKRQVAAEKELRHKQYLEQHKEHETAQKGILRQLVAERNKNADLKDNLNKHIVTAKNVLSNLEKKLAELS